MARIASHETATMALADLLWDTRDTTFRALVVGGSPEAVSPRTIAIVADYCDLVVAVDHGADTLLKAHYLPDVMVGDADSVDAKTLSECEASGAQFIRAIPEKDETDLELAMRYLAPLATDPEAFFATNPQPGAREAWLEKAAHEGFSLETIVCSVSGGRLDHQLGVLGVLKTHAALRPVVVEETMQGRVLSPKGRAAWDIPGELTGSQVSIMPLSDGTVVSETGLAWELDRFRMDALSDRGVSNVVAAPGARMTVHEGCALAILPMEADAG